MRSSDRTSLSSMACAPPLHSPTAMSGPPSRSRQSTTSSHSSFHPSPATSWTRGNHHVAQVECLQHPDHREDHGYRTVRRKRREEPRWPILPSAALEERRGVKPLTASGAGHAVPEVTQAVVAANGAGRALELYTACNAPRSISDRSRSARRECCCSANSFRHREGGSWLPAHVEARNPLDSSRRTPWSRSRRQPHRPPICWTMRSAASPAGLVFAESPASASTRWMTARSSTSCRVTLVASTSSNAAIPLDSRRTSPTTRRVRHAQGVNAGIGGTSEVFLSKTAAAIGADGHQPLWLAEAVRLDRAERVWREGRDELCAAITSCLNAADDGASFARPPMRLG